MAILSDPTNRKANSTTLEDLDYDDFLSETEASEAVAATYEIPPAPPGIMVTVHLDSNPKKIFKTEHRQQLGDSFDYSNSDLHNVINIGRNAKIVIINKGEEHEEVEAYNPTSNYRLPDNYGYNSPYLIKYFIQDVFCTPKGSTRISKASFFAKHSEHLHLLPTKTTRKRINTRKSLLTIKEEGASRMGPTTSGPTPGFTPNKG